MPVAAVAELVRDHGQDLRRARLLEEGVVEDDAPGGAETGDVRVQLRRPLAGVGDEHLANRDGRVVAQLQHGVAQARGLDRAELVEDRLEHDRRDEAEQEHDEGAAGRGRERPGGRERLRAEDEAGQRGAREHRADRDRLQPVEREVARALAREAERALVQQAEPDAQRQAHERGDVHDQEPEQERAERLRQRVDDPEHRLTEGREREHGRDGEPERDVGEDARDSAGRDSGGPAARRPLRAPLPLPRSVCITALNEPLTDARFSEDYTLFSGDCGAPRRPEPRASCPLDGACRPVAPPHPRRHRRRRADEPGALHLVQGVQRLEHALVAPRDRSAS